VSMREWLRNIQPGMLHGSRFASGDDLLRALDHALSQPRAVSLVASCGLDEDDALACCAYTAPCPELFGAANRQTAALLRAPPPARPQPKWA